MATGGYRTSGGSTTDFLEEWKAKREKMRAKQNPPGPLAPGGGSGDAAGKPPAGALPTSAAPSELNNYLPGAAAPAAPGPGGVNCVGGSAALTRAAPGPRRTEDESTAGAAAASSGAQPARGDEEEPDGAPEKGKSSGPSARKGKGQIEKRKLREKRRSTGVVNIPAAEVSRVGAGPGWATASSISRAQGFPHFQLVLFTELGRQRMMEFYSEQMFSGKFLNPK
ncbi:PRKC apoptosis WT1 regulator protein [Galemys pyrenaicus]|uniref:PRKC apoptosis WT1 regulator protein n=1 Tax=Galemys pyrenaicus TaxID=202257 RepID=A0A8J6A7Y5_GALPY|nr:PRKC apoptosis WT1 regulator protein [Galemys pyrenaicus]